MVCNFNRVYTEHTYIFTKLVGRYLVYTMLEMKCIGHAIIYVFISL